MPSGEAPPASGRRDRTLEQLGASTRLELGLGGVVRVLRRRWVVLLAVVAVTFVAVYAGTSLLAKRYSSVAWIKITDASENVFVEAGKSVDLTKEQRAVLLTLESPRLRDDLQKKLGTAAFKKVSSVTAIGLEASPLIRMDAEASSPKLAEGAANTAAAFVLRDRRDKQSERLKDQAAKNDARAEAQVANVDTLSAALAELPEASERRQSLEARLSAATSQLTATVARAEQQRSDAEAVDGGLEIFEEATRPLSPDYPKPKGWAVLASLAALLITVGVIYGREELVGRFHSGDASESRRAGARVLGVLPERGGALPRGVVTGAGATVDEVGLQVVHLLGRSKPNVVLFSGVDGPAAEVTTRRIAQAIAESGARVVYAACRGVVETANDDEFEAPVPRARLSVVQEQQTGGRLRVLDDGIAVGELTVARARTVLRRLTEQCEYVVIAAPSPTIEPATLVLAELADATVLIAQHGVTKLRDAERAATRLRRVGGAVLGVLSDPAKPGTASAAYVARAAGVSAS